MKENNNEIYEVKNITSKYDSCHNCGLPSITCICKNVKKLKTYGEFIILSTLREVKKPSNTARIFKLLNKDKTHIVIWERTKEPKELVQMLNDPKYEPYIVFPAYTEELKKRQTEFKKKSNKIPLFILIDGTWKEARRILRKSSYLHKVSILELNVNGETEYTLRRGIESLCTIEACIELLKSNEEYINANYTKEIFHLFMKAYKSGACGHELKPL